MKNTAKPAMITFAILGALFLGFTGLNAVANVGGNGGITGDLTECGTDAGVPLNDTDSDVMRNGVSTIVQNNDSTNAVWVYPDDDENHTAGGIKVYPGGDTFTWPVGPHKLKCRGDGADVNVNVQAVDR